MGTDGLAGGTIMVAMLFMAAIAYRSNNLDGAVFAEVGNVWDLRDPLETGSSLAGLPGNLAADWGLGLRLDFDIILVRLDLGIRAHDPAREAGDRWVKPADWFRGGNYAVHFGVGYPF